MNDYQEKLRSLGFSTKRGTSKRVDKVNEDTGKPAGYEVEHWDDARDAVVTPAPLKYKIGRADA